MKYIIWGAGNRGNWTLQFLGSEKVIAFTDGNSEKIGKVYCGKRIVSPKEAMEFKDTILVITPINGSDEIERWLMGANFHRYMKLDACPMSIPCDEQEGYSFELRYNKAYSYGLLGVNLFSLWLYDELKKNKIQVKMAAQAELCKDILEVIDNECEMVSQTLLAKGADKIIVMLDAFCNPDADDKYISADDFIIQNMPACNPEILQYKDIHKGKRCFIVATGPSLTVEDLNTLYEHKEICISMNRIFNIFSKTNWRPDYYMIGDKEMIEDLSEDIARLDLPNKFVSTVPKVYWQHPDSKDSIPYKMLLRGITERRPTFSQYAEQGLFHGTTVTYLCMQLAVYMGFSEIYLLGVDFSYSNNLYDPKNHFEGCDNSENNVRLNPVYPEKTLLAYESSRIFCDSHNVKIFNATRGGKLEVFERKSFDSLFESQ